MTTKIIKHIYPRNNNVYLGVCEMVFMCIITFKNYCQFEKGLWVRFRVCRHAFLT